MWQKEFKKYGSRKFLICSASVILTAAGNYLGKVESNDFALVVSIAIGAYTAANWGTAKLESVKEALDTGGSA